MIPVAAMPICRMAVRLRLFPGWWLLSKLSDVGVGQPASRIFSTMAMPTAASFRLFEPFLRCHRLSLPDLASLASGVIHAEIGLGTEIRRDPEETVPAVWRIDTASRDINRPAGVVLRFQIRLNSVEPTVASAARNLLSHDKRWPDVANESMKVWPKVPRIGSAFVASG